MPHYTKSRGTTRRFKILTTAAAVAAATVIAFVGTVAAQTEQRFEDVPPDHYAYAAVDWAVEHGITGGCGDGTNFCPEQNLNRAHMVTFLKRYHDRFGTGITVAWGEPVDASGGATLTGTGPNITGPVTVGEGRWGIALAVQQASRLGYVGLDAFGEAPGRELLVGEIVEANAYGQTAQFRAGSDLFDDLEPGKVWFEVQVDPDVTWTITVAPL